MGFPILVRWHLYIESAPWIIIHDFTNTHPTMLAQHKLLFWLSLVVLHLDMCQHIYRWILKHRQGTEIWHSLPDCVASFTKEVNWRLAKRPLVFNGRLANTHPTMLAQHKLLFWLSLVVLHLDMCQHIYRWILKHRQGTEIWHSLPDCVASFTKEVNWRLAKRPLVFNGRLANRQLTSLVKEADQLENWL